MPAELAAKGVTPVVGKDKLIAVLWPKQVVEESNLTQQVFLLRKALSRHSSGAKIIETVPGRGYRFAAPIEFIPPPKSQPPGAGAPGTSPLAEAPSGSSLQKLAAGLGKAEEWQRIARNNGIENPRLLNPGQLIDMNIPKFGG